MGRKRECENREISETSEKAGNFRLFRLFRDFRILSQVFVLTVVTFSGVVIASNAIQEEKRKEAEEPDWGLLLPEDEGRAEVLLSCSNCHGLKQLITQKKTKSGWRNSVQKMISTYQAPVDKEDIPVLISYLARHFGEGNPLEQLPVNINTGSAAQLERLPGISAARAKAIIEHRTVNGFFESIESLQSVNGIDAEALKQIRPFIKLKD